MKNFKRKEQKQMGNKGFSLVELIVVIAIMAVLVAVLAPQFTKYVDRSRQSNDATTVSGIVNAVQIGIADVATYNIQADTYVITLPRKNAAATVTATNTSGNATKVIQAITDTCGELADLNVTANAWTTVTIQIEVTSDGTTVVKYGPNEFADYIGKEKITP